MKTPRLVAGIAAAALGLGGVALAQAVAAPPEGRPYGQASAVRHGTGELSDAERATLLLMVDEERMARDLYASLADTYPDAVQFERIAASEQRHYDATLRLVEAYALQRPADGPAGTYDNAEVKERYDGWSKQAQASVEAAYQVGVDLETADIADLKAAIEESDNTDLDRVYGNLLAASERHVEAFRAGLDGQVLGGQQRMHPTGQQGTGAGPMNGEGRQGQGRMHGHGGGQGWMHGQGGGQGAQLRDGSCLQN